MLVWERARYPARAPLAMSLLVRFRFAGPRTSVFDCVPIWVMRGCSQGVVVALWWWRVRRPVVPFRVVRIGEEVGPMFAPRSVLAVSLLQVLEVVAERITIWPKDVWHNRLGVGYAWRVVPLGGGMRLFHLVGTHLDANGLWHLWGDLSSRRAPVQNGPAFTVRAGGGAGVAWRPNEFLSLGVLVLAPQMLGRGGLGVLGCVPVAIQSTISHSSSGGGASSIDKWKLSRCTWSNCRIRSIWFISVESRPCALVATWTQYRDGYSRPSCLGRP